MKFSTLANPNIDEAIDPHTIDLFAECHKELCAWYCTYPNGEDECTIHSLPGMFDILDSIATQIAMK